jgi:hypothetical protein
VYVRQNTSSAVCRTKTHGPLCSDGPCALHTSVISET